MGARVTIPTKLNAGKQRRLGQQPGERVNSPRAESVNTCKALTLPAFQLHEYVEYKPAHIGRIERIAGGMYWVANERTPYLVHQLTRLAPDPDVCSSCLGTGDCGDTRVDSYNNTKDYPCPSCGGSGKRK